jgi:hypothetical protein
MASKPVSEQQAGVRALFVNPETQGIAPTSGVDRVNSAA